MIASRRRRIDIGTNQRTGDLTMRYGFRSQLAPLDCTSSRRSTVMCALSRVTGITTEYQRDSSSKRPMSSVALVARPCHGPWKLSPQALDNRSFPIKLGGRKRSPRGSSRAGIRAELRRAPQAQVARWPGSRDDEPIGLKSVGWEAGIRTPIPWSRGDADALVLS